MILRSKWKRELKRFDVTDIRSRKIDRVGGGLMAVPRVMATKTRPPEGQYSENKLYLS
jgi:hypothetical protein